MSQCKNESKENKFGKLCEKGYTFCMEDMCPDYKPIDGIDKQDA